MNDRIYDIILMFITGALFGLAWGVASRDGEEDKKAETVVIEKDCIIPQNRDCIRKDFGLEDPVFICVEQKGE